MNKIVTNTDSHIYHEWLSPELPELYCCTCMYILPIVTPYSVHALSLHVRATPMSLRTPGPAVYIRSQFPIWTIILDKVYQSALATQQCYNILGTEYAEYWIFCPSYLKMAPESDVSCHHMQVFGAAWSGNELCINSLYMYLFILYLATPLVKYFARIACFVCCPCAGHCWTCFSKLSQLTGVALKTRAALLTWEDMYSRET